MSLFWHPDHENLRGVPWMPRGWRHITYSRLFRFLYPAVFRVMFGMRICGLENIPLNQACIFVGNHGSHFDGFMMIGVLMRISVRSAVPVAWHKIFDFPIIGPFVKSLGAVAIEHGEGAVPQRMNAVHEMVRRLREGRHLTIFAEGQRSDTLGPFNRGAAQVSLRTKAPIVPFTLRGVQPLYKRMDRIPKFWGRVEVIFHPPIEPEAYQGSKFAAAIMMWEVRSKVASVLDYPDGNALRPSHRTQEMLTSGEGIFPRLTGQVTGSCWDGGREIH